MDKHLSIPGLHLAVITVAPQVSIPVQGLSKLAEYEAVIGSFSANCGMSEI
jgi:hypothetical protein